MLFADLDVPYMPVVDDEGMPNILLLPPALAQDPIIESMADEMVSKVPRINSEIMHLNWGTMPEVS